MKAQTFFAGLALAVALVVAAVVVGDRHPGEVKTGERLIPALSERINDVTRIRIQGPDNATTTLIRADEVWQVAERQYPAEIGDIRELLISLSEATILERKTSNPTLYERLGVQNYGTGETSNKQILLWAGDEQLAGLVLGKTAEQPRGSYVRLVGGDSAALTDQVIVATADATQWLNTSLVNIKPDAIASIAIEPDEGTAYTIARADDDAGKLVLQNVPDGRSTKGASVARVTRVLQNLRAEDVLATDASVPETGWARLTFTTTGGSTLTVRAHEGDDDSDPLLQIGAELADDDSTAGLDTLSDAADGRTFTVQTYKVRDATLTRNELLQPADDAE